MERRRLLGQLLEVFVKTLGNRSIELSESTVPSDIAEWDSLAHIQLVVAIEKYYHIRFRSEEILKWSNIGSILDSIAEKLEQSA